MKLCRYAINLLGFLSLSISAGNAMAQARIEISGTAHPGVRIRFAEHELSIKDPLQAPVFVFDPQSKSIITRS